MLVEHGGHGGDVSAPLAMDIIHNYFETVAPADKDAPHVGRPKRRAPRPADERSGTTAAVPPLAAPAAPLAPAAPAPEATP